MNHLGSAHTAKHRCIAFPNSYQHRVSPFELVEKSKPGYRKVLALFLVDPERRRVSTRVVPPQQREWRTADIAANRALKDGLGKLAPEIVDRIGSMAGGLVTRQEAEEYRLEMIKERKAYDEENNSKWVLAPFDMCG